MNVRCPFVLRSIFSGWSIEGREGQSGKEGEGEGRGGGRTAVSVRPFERGESLIVLMWPKTNLDTAAAAEEASDQVSKQRRLLIQHQHGKSECEKNLLRVANAAAIANAIAIAIAVAVLRG